jgi:hypothetical protein
MGSVIMSGVIGGKISKVLEDALNFFKFRDGENILPSLEAVEESFAQEQKKSKDVDKSSVDSATKIISKEWPTLAFIKFLVEKIYSRLRPVPPKSNILYFRKKSNLPVKGKSLDKVA